eukprot:6559587-Lingulodinium_polyedra.AAC.1
MAEAHLRQVGICAQAPRQAFSTAWRRGQASCGLDVRFPGQYAATRIAERFSDPPGVRPLRPWAWWLP